MKIKTAQGQAACDEFERQGDQQHRLSYDWDEVAQAAVDASGLRETVERLRLERDFGGLWWWADRLECAEVELIDPRAFPEPIDADEHMRIEQVLKEIGA